MKRALVSDASEWILIDSAPRLFSTTCIKPMSRYIWERIGCQIQFSRRRHFRHIFTEKIVVTMIGIGKFQLVFPIICIFLPINAKKAKLNLFLLKELRKFVNTLQFSCIHVSWHQSRRQAFWRSAQTNKITSIVHN